MAGSRPIAPLALCLMVAVAGCGEGVSPFESTRTDALWGQALFQENCAACHGADAEGGGPASLGLGVVPPGLTRLAARNGGIFPKDRVMSVIDGYYRRDHYSDPMPVFGDEDMGPLVQVEVDGVSTPIPAKLLAVANYLQSVQVESP